MAIRAPLIVSLLIISGMCAMSLWAAPQIPGGARIATHFDFSGLPNGTMTKTWALWFSPTMAAALTLLFASTQTLFGRFRERFRGGEAISAAWLGTLLLVAVAHAIVLLRARGTVLDVSGNLIFATSLFFIVVGNFLGKLEPNGFAGVRTYWTYRSDYSWEKSNRLAGRLMVASGLLTIAALALFGSPAGKIVFFAGLTILAVVSVAASYFYWRADPDRQR